ncbi:hypothetical protein SLA2020_464990 [Shorea laevis]
MGLLPSTTAVLFLAMLALLSTLDMLIISYDESRAQKSSWRIDDEVMAIYEAWLSKHGENRSYRVGLNKFIDLTNEEYQATYLGAKKSPRKISKRTDRYQSRLNDALPDSVDWRKEGTVVEVKDQGVVDVEKMESIRDVEKMEEKCT